MKRESFTGRLAWVALGLVAVVSISASSPQCVRVGDRATGVRDDAFDPQAGVSICVKVCNDGFKAATTSEQSRHTAAVKDCNGDKDCIADEQNTHVAARQKIAADLQTCKAICHNQGSGSGGQ